MGGGKKNKKQQENEDFDALLKEVQKKTKEVGTAKQKAQGNKQNNNQGGTRADRQTKHKELHNALNKAKEAEFERALERQHQQQKIQQLLQQMQGMGGMGGYSPFLQKPNTELSTEKKNSKLFDVATVEMQGWRKEMEDAHFNDLEFSSGEEAGLFGVFDGHSGKKTAQIAKVVMPALAKKHYDATQLDTANFFYQVFQELDASLKDKAEGSGATAVVALVSKEYISCASVGDSRAVLCRGTEAVTLSYDHKPENDDERKRIEAAGGHVEANRVNGELAMSRAIGDFRYKGVAGKPVAEQLVIAVPEIHTVARQPEDKFVVVACDGIFDVMTNDEVVAFVLENRPQCKTLAEVGEKLLNTCLAPIGEAGRPTRPVGTDNMTCTIIELK